MGLTKSRARLAALRSELQAVDGEKLSASQSLGARDTLLVQRGLCEAQQAVLFQLRSAMAPNLWDRIARILGQETSRMLRLRMQLEKPILSIDEGIRSHGAVSSQGCLT